MLEIYNLASKQTYLEEVLTLEMKEWGSDFSLEKLKEKCIKVRKQMQEPNFCKLILLKNDVLLGFVSIFPEDGLEELGLTPWYATLYVKKEYRGLGYAQILNESILREACKRGFKEIYLKTELQGFYEKFGALHLKNVGKERIYKFVL